ncbi:MAG: histidinol phosphate phosphatase [Clostridium sp.]
MVFDCHMHSMFSSDSEMNIEDAILAAKEQNLGIILTEHTDFNYPDPNLFRLNVKEYFDTYSKYRSDNLLLGVEIGLSQSINDQNSAFVNSNNFDFVIGSMHGVFDEDIYRVFRINPIPKKDFYSRYFEDMYTCIKDFPDFDVLGHIDYPCRYIPYEDKEIYYSEFSNEIDEVLKMLISKNKLMELNTARVNNKTSYNNLLEIYKRYKELGGNYVTIGSDAHNSAHIGKNFKEGLQLIHEAGLKTVYFQNRILIEN